MGVLRVTALAFLASCYSPSAREWSVPVPDADTDAAPPPRDAPGPDAVIADAPPDAPLPIVVQISVMGPGSVTLVGSGVCTKSCTLFADYGKTATAEAVPAPKNKFAGWTSTTCLGQPATCTFVPLSPVTLGARFMKED